ncbi:MAG: hypothetical protein AAGJ08_19925 [Cyanobacteria bacterium P01_H01_bin.35]
MAEYSFSGKRVKPGLYKTKQEKLINADGNRTANMGVKSNLNGFNSDRRLGIFDYAIKDKIWRDFSPTNLSPLRIHADLFSGVSNSKVCS